MKPYVMFVFAAILAACGGGGGGGSSSAGASSDQPLALGEGGAPLVIGHRGASGYLPEHTLESYAKAIEQGADVIEPDLVATKDHVLIARHEPNLIATTDVAERPEFASRKCKKLVDGIEEEGFFASDFTLAEIKTLRAKQQLAERSQAFNGLYPIPTFDEVIALAQDEARKRGRAIGIYPETKHPTFHQQRGLPLEDKLLAALDKAGWNRAGAPVFIQSFETANLKYLRSKSKVRLIQLVDGDGVDPKTGEITYAPPFDMPYDWRVAGRSGTFGDLLTPAGLDEVKSYADGIAPWKRYLVATTAITLDAAGVPQDANGDGLVNETDFVAVPKPALFAQIKAKGLLLHSWTFRNEPRRLAASYGGDPAKEYAQFFELAWTACSAISRTPRWQRATRS